MKEKSGFETFLTGNCPRCRQGKMFKHGPYKIPGFMSMNTHCPHCGVHFEKEPGFWYGAMYVSYMLSVAIFVTVSVGLYLFAGDPPLTTYIVSVLIASIILYPINFRYSRIIFLHVFSGFKYDPSFK